MNHCGNLPPRLIQSIACRTALAVHRRGIAGLAEREPHSLDDRRPYRGGGIPIEVDSRAHVTIRRQDAFPPAR